MWSGRCRLTLSMSPSTAHEYAARCDDHAAPPGDGVTSWHHVASGTAGCSAERQEGHHVRELEASLQQFREVLLKEQLVQEKAASYCGRWVPIPHQTGLERPARRRGAPAL
jgi:phosphatidylethanolamine-binding protein (PEBP) family uncharacterized protein